MRAVANGSAGRERARRWCESEEGEEGGEGRRRDACPRRQAAACRGATCLHGAKLCCKGAANTPGEDDGCHHWRQLTRQCERKHAAYAARETKLGKLPHKLDCEDHADKASGQESYAK